MFKAVKPDFSEIELKEEHRKLFATPPVPKISEWAEGNFVLTKGYAATGKMSFNGREWQRDICDAFDGRYKTVIVCKPVQVGGSLCAVDVPWTWWNKFIGGRSLIVNADKEKAESVFEERIRPNIKVNILEHWTGNEDDLKREKIVLNNGVCRCGSANVENDFATFPADYVFLDEVAKFASSRKETGGFDCIKAARGRQREYNGMIGAHGVLSIVSSPKRHGDPLYNEIFKGGVLILRCHLPCPACGKYQELTDEQIKEIPNDKGEKDHNPSRIIQENAAEYECVHCKGTIRDIDRWKMLKNYRWLAEGEDVKNGEIINQNPLRDKAVDVCFWFNRLLSMPDKFTFADCLAAFFVARSSPDPKAWEAYQNEDMARFINPKAEKASYSYLLSKQLDYYQYSELARVPQGVEIIFAGIDTQDDGFYYVVRGFGRNMETWLIRQDFIHCDMKESKYNDPAEVLEQFKRRLFLPVYVRQDGLELPIYAGFIDEGGHRQQDVRYICKHLHIFKSYKGSSTAGADLIKKSSNGDHYIGNTQQLSEIVHRYMTGDTWYYPKDISKSYLEQVVRQYWQEERDSKGNLKYRWVHGGIDHYRDAENYCMGMVVLNNLQERLSTDEGIAQIRNIVMSKATIIKRSIAQEQPIQQERKPQPFRDPTAYRDMLRQGGRRIRF